MCCKCWFSADSFHDIIKQVRTEEISVKKNTFIGDRKFYKYVLMLVVPMIIQNAITSFVSLLDNIMVGQIGTEQMSGVAIVNQLMFVYNSALFGGVGASGIFGTQFFGKGDYQGQKYAFRFKLLICLGITAVVVLLGTFADTELISLYLAEEGSTGDIRLAMEYGKEYMKIMLIGLWPFAVGQAYVNSIRETGQTRVPMIASVTAVLTNLVLDVVLIFGLGPIPAMGVKGAAIATVIARFIECGIVMVWAHRNAECNQFVVGVYRSMYIPKQLRKEIIIKGIPIFLNETIWSIGMAIIAQCYARRGLDVVAAQNISSTITNLFMIVCGQLGACIGIVVGQLLGAGQLKEAREADNRLIFFCVMCGVVLGAVVMILGGLFPQIYNTEENIKELATAFIRISALIMPANAFCQCVYHTLRAGGQTGLIFIFDNVFIWLVTVPAALILTNFTPWPIVIVYLLIQMIEVLKAVLGFVMVKRGKWLRTLVGE